MKLINSNKKCLLFKDGSFFVRNEVPGAWIEARNVFWDFDGISPTKSLAEAIYEYFRSKQQEPWPTEQAFLRLTCGWCKAITVYNNKTDLPTAFGDSGYLVCPCCQAPWLMYEYHRRK
jgi:hypothetical protein